MSQVKSRSSRAAKIRSAPGLAAGEESDLELDGAASVSRVLVLAWFGRVHPAVGTEQCRYAHAVFQPYRNVEIVLRSRD